MFTGLVETIGTVRRISRERCLVLVIDCLFAPECTIGDSVAVDGVCLTVTRALKNTLEFAVMPLTASGTTLKYLRAGRTVNFERALKAGARIGGHIVTGHVDCIGKVTKITPGTGSSLLNVSFPESFSGLVTDKGSIALSGVSLTVQSRSAKSCVVGLIPATLSATTLGLIKSGDLVNVEFDTANKHAVESIPSSLNMKKLKEWGF
ncbi:MAG: riboflavin synthase [Candidatus Wallbacteria bacterium]|nr:riboflavin synthase [Candidatus Wallbacteria bacterium]